MAFDPSKYSSFKKGTANKTLERQFDPSKYSSFRKQDSDLQRLRQMQAENPVKPVAQRINESVEDFGTAGLETVTSLGRGLSQVGASIPEAVYGAVGATGLAKNATEFKSQMAAREIEGRKQLEAARSRSPAASFVGETLPFLLSPGAGFWRAAGAGAAISGLSGKTEDENRFVDALFGGAVAGSANKLISGLTGRQERGFNRLIDKGGLGDDVINFKNKLLGRPALPDRMKDVAEGLKGTKGNLSPQEALGPQFGRNETLQSNVRLNSRQARMLDDAIRNRSLENVTEFNSTLKSITPEGLDKAKSKAAALFKRVDDTPIPTDIAIRLSKNGSIAKRLNKVSTDPDLGAQETAINKLSRWRAVKGQIRDDINRELAPQADGSVIVTDKARRLQQARKILDKSLDDLSPEYKLARAIDQRVSIQENFTNQVKKIKSIDKTLTESDIHRKIFSDENYRDFFLKELKEANVDVDGVKPLILTLGRLSKSKVTSVTKNSAGLVESLTDKTTASKEAGIQESAKYLLSKAYSADGQALIKAVTDPKWFDDLQRLNKRLIKLNKSSDILTDKTNRIILYREFGDFFGRVAADKATEEKNK